MTDPRIDRIRAAINGAMVGEWGQHQAFLALASLVAERETTREAAGNILSLTIAAEGGRQFPTRAEFDRCLDFLARLSEDGTWAFLLRGSGGTP